MAGFCGDEILAHHRQPAGQIRSAGGADHHAAVSRVGEDLAVVLIELLGLLGPLPLERVAAVHIVHDICAFIEAIEIRRGQVRAFQFGLPVVIAHGQDVRPVQIAIGEVGRLTGRAAAQVCLRDGHQLLGAQESMIFCRETCLAAPNSPSSMRCSQGVNRIMPYNLLSQLICVRN